MKPGDVVVGVLEGAVETKVRPAVVIASTIYLAERPDVLVGILTTRPPKPAASADKTGRLRGFERSPIFGRSCWPCIVRR